MIDNKRIKIIETTKMLFDLLNAIEKYTEDGGGSRLIGKYSTYIHEELTCIISEQLSDKDCSDEEE